MRFLVAFAALAATTAFAAPAAAQEAPPPAPVEPAPEPTPAEPTTGSADIDARALILQPATIVAGDDLDFGTVLASTTGGTVTVDPDPANPVVTDSGGATAVSGAQRGSFRGNYLPGEQVQVDVRYDKQLSHTNGGNSFLLYQGAASGDGSVTVRPDGLFTVFVGGTITVSGGQEPGQYEGKVFVDAQFQ